MAALRLREYATAISAPRSRPLPRPRMPPVIEIFGVRYQKGTLKMNWLRVFRSIYRGSVIKIVDLCFYAVAPRAASTVLCHR